ncbi:MAG: hypothetical protein IKK49_00805 [Clostridia bacterium]|nr:hypothetical protein [Clostridia bacterium]
MFKKTVCIFSALCLLFGLCVSATEASDILPPEGGEGTEEVVSARKEALPTSAGIKALRDEFEIDRAPEAEGFALDYAYYSPVGEEDDTKYPLVIFLHGIGHGDYEGSQLADSDMPYWASAELQSRFTSGGAFVLLPRSPEDKLVYWSSSMIEPLRSVIDDVIAKHGDNIDTTKIFISGSSAGAEMAWFMVTTYPEYFAGAFPIAATGSVSASEIQACSDVAIWMFSSRYDPAVNYSLITTPLWSNVKEYNNNPENCRLTTLESVVEPAGNAASDNHHMAKVITYDFHMLDGSAYPNATTVNGNGETLTLESPDGIISWMNSVSSDYDGELGVDDSNIIENIIQLIINTFRNLGLKIVNIFQRILGL